MKQSTGLLIAAAVVGVTAVAVVAAKRGPFPVTANVRYRIEGNISGFPAEDLAVFEGLARATDPSFAWGSNGDFSLEYTAPKTMIVPGRISVDSASITVKSVKAVGT